MIHYGGRWNDGVAIKFAVPRQGTRRVEYLHVLVSPVPEGFTPSLPSPDAPSLHRSLSVGSVIFQIGLQDAFFPLQKRLWLVFFVIMKLTLHIFRQSCALTSQLSLNFRHNLPSEIIFSWFSNPPNLEFCNTLQCFSWFFNISANRFEDASQAPN